MNLKSDFRIILTKLLFCVFFFATSISINAQDTLNIKQKSEFWKKVRFGGGLGLGIGNGFTNIMVAPSAIYPINNYVSAGIGAQYSYARQRNEFQSHLYGASVMGLFNPLEFLQVSVEVEQLRVNNTITLFSPRLEDDFWNTALFLGGGYRSENVTVGVRYNVLYKADDRVYSQAWMPFVRVFF